jgi:multicomponent Na+:H+ antiporter subunit E
MAGWLNRVWSVGAWAMLTWEVLAWTLTWEQQLTGVAIALAVGVSMAGFGDVPGPWKLLRPRTAAALLRLLAKSSYAVVRANLSLSRRIWAPSRPLRSGMLVLPTRMRSDAGLAATALLSSLVVDNQCVDLDRSSRQLQYHVVAVPSGDPQARSEQINAPTENLLSPLVADGLARADRPERR